MARDMWLVFRNQAVVWRRARVLAGFAWLFGALGAALLSIVPQANHAQRAAASSGTLRTVEVNRATEQSPPLTAEDVRTVEGIMHVVGVQPVLTTTAGLKQKPILGLLLNLTVARASTLPPIVAKVRDQVFPLHEGEIVLPARADNQDLRPVLGATVTLDLSPDLGGRGGSATFSARVVALYDPHWQYDARDAAYLTLNDVVHCAAVNANLSESDFLATHGYDSLLATVDQASHVDQVIERIQADGYQARSQLQVQPDLPGTLVLLDDLGKLLVAAMIVAVIFGVAAFAMAMTRPRIREFAILRAVGYRRRDLFAVVLGEGIVLSLGLAAGIMLFGVVAASVAQAVLRQVATLRGFSSSAVVVLPPGRAILGIMLFTGFAVIAGSTWAAVRAARLEPAQALRDVV